jgi:hypothetical protein
MKTIITSLMMFFSVMAFAQKPMVGFTPAEIKQQNYLEFSTLYDSWNVDEADGFYMLYTEVPNIDGYAYYYFANGAELNYLSALIMYNSDSFKSIKSKTIKSCVRQSNGWYKHTSTGLYIYFQTTVKEGKKLYSILYTYDMFDVK